MTDLAQRIKADITTRCLTWRSRAILAFIRADGGYLSSRQIEDAFHLGRHTGEILVDLSERGFLERVKSGIGREYHYRARQS